MNLLYHFGFEPPIIDFFGIQLIEPMTMATDWLIAICCISFGIYLKNRAETEAQTSWSMFFLVMGTSTFIAGIAHSFIFYIGDYGQMIARITSCVGLYYAERGAYQYCLSNSKPWLVFSKIKLVVFVGLIAVFNEFIFVKTNSFIAMMGIVFCLHIYAFIKNRDVLSKWIILGVVVAIPSAVVNSLMFTINDKWLSYHDLGHYIMLMSFYLLFLAQKKSLDSPLYETDNH